MARDDDHDNVEADSGKENLPLPKSPLQGLQNCEWAQKSWKP